MNKKFIFLMLVLSFIFISSANAKNIVWVAMNWNADGSGTVNDDWQEFTNGLTAEGYTVDIRPGYWDALTDAKVIELNAADLVIFSRAIQSGTFATNAAEIALWNSVTAPMLNCSAYVLRKGRWNWVLDDSTIPYNAGDQGCPLMNVLVPSHYIFYGVSLDANKQLQFADPTLRSGNCSFATTNAVGNGKLIAKTVPTTLVQDWAWIVEWQKGVEFYPGSGSFAGGHRLYLSAGAHETAGNGNTVNKASGYNLTSEGWKLYINAVRYMLGELDPKKASSPNPKDTQTEVSIDTSLSWVPGMYADTHNVFFGSDINDVTNATLSDPLSTEVFTVDVNMLDIYRLAYGTTYYWRVDEVNIPSKQGTNVGKVWEFTTEPEGYELAVENVVGVEFNSPYEVYDFQEPNTTYNGVGLDDVNGTHSNDNTTMWVGMGDGPGDVWLQYELDKIYKLHQLKIWNYNEAQPSLPFGAKDVNVLYSIDNVTWKALDEIQVFPMATGESTYKADIFVDMNGAIAKYVKLSFLSSYSDGMYTGGISEIRFLVIPTCASNPSPANNATNVKIGSILSWKAGRDAVVHKIYIDSDEDSVINGTSDIIAETTDPNYSIVLELSKTYYWRVDEVNNAEEYATWDGPVWKFSTPQSVLIEGFESGYGNDVTTNAVFKTWKDGAELGDSANGSWMGRKSAPYLQTINHSGGHSAPMAYDNQSYSYSEVIADTTKLLNGSNWSKGNPSALVIWFRSDSNDVNEPATDRLYVELSGANKKVYDGPASYIRRAAWTRWEIPLTGISLGNVTSITIGVERIGSTGGIGTLYLDDIMLTKLSPAPTNPGTTGLLAKYAMENNVQDTSGNGLNGTLVGTANGGLTYVDGLSGYGKALVFDGNDDCVDLGNKPEFNPAGSFSVSLWAKINTWSTNWGHVMIANQGEGTIGWQIRRYSSNSLSFTTRGVSNDDTNSNATPAINAWTNITCVYDSAAHTKSIYIDGVLDKTVNLTGTTYVIGATTHNTYIGARANTANTAKEGFFKGILDQILIYNRALSASEAMFLADPTP